MQVFPVGGKYLLVHGELLQLQLAGGRVQQPEHDPLAMGRGYGGHPDIHRMPGDLHGYPAILWHPLFGDIQLGHDLDP